MRCRTYLPQSSVDGMSNGLRDHRDATADDHAVATYALLASGLVRSESRRVSEVEGVSDDGRVSKDIISSTQDHLRLDLVESADVSQPISNRQHHDNTHVISAGLSLFESTPASKIEETTSRLADGRDPLGDVLEWLARSELGTDHRFVAADHGAVGFAKSSETSNDEEAPMSSSARELYADVVDEIGPAARAHAPRSRAPLPAKSTLSTSASCPNLEASCLDSSNVSATRPLDEEEREWSARQKTHWHNWSPCDLH